MAEPTGPSASEIVFYQGEDGRSRIQFRLDGGTPWLTQRLMSELFQVSVPTVNEHLANIYEDGEADPGATTRKFRIVQTEASREVSRLVDHYTKYEKFQRRRLTDEARAAAPFEEAAKQLGPLKPEKTKKKGDR